MKLKTALAAGAFLLIAAGCQHDCAIVHGIKDGASANKRLTVDCQMVYFADGNHYLSCPELPDWDGEKDLMCVTNSPHELWCRESEF